MAGGKIRAALLVDADNLPIAQVEEALEKLAKICNPVIKKAFGDFTRSAKNWSADFQREHGFTPVMHFAVSNFKNGADIAMSIAAMDIVHAKTVDAIVLFTSDSDFASLAARIREAGLEAVGVGDAKASIVLRNSFDTFVVIGAAKKLVKSAVKPDLGKPTQKTKAKPAVQKKPAAAVASKQASSTKKPVEKTNSVEAFVLKSNGASSIAKPETPTQPPSKAVPKIISAMKTLDAKDGLFRLGELSAELVACKSGFDPKNYGCTNLSNLLEKTGQFVVMRQAGNIHVKRKNHNKAKAL